MSTQPIDNLASLQTTLLGLIPHIRCAIEENSFLLTSSEKSLFIKDSIHSKPIPHPSKPSVPVTQTVAVLNPSKPPPSVPEPFLLNSKQKSSPPIAPLSNTNPLSSDVLADEVAWILKKVAPHVVYFKDIPDDTIAKKMATRWKTKNQAAPISVLCYNEPVEHKALLEQITQAIDVYFGPAKLIQSAFIEKEKQWEAFFSAAELKRVIVCDYTLWQLEHLRSFYKEYPAEKERTIGNKPLFLLPDLSLYLKDPLLKKSLWKALCQKLS